MTPNATCALCGLAPAAGFAMIDGKRYCHGDDREWSCYERAGWRTGASGSTSVLSWDDIVHRLPAGQEEQ